MLSVYSHLSNEDIDRAVLERNGIRKPPEPETRLMAARQCRRCMKIIPPTASFCATCGLPLTEEVLASLRELMAFIEGYPGAALLLQPSALDAETERTVRASLRDLRKGKTTLVVSHHPQVLADADRVILLEKGQITAEGTYWELEERGSISGNPG